VVKRVTGEIPAWSIQSALVSVSDLDGSVAFYTDVMKLHEILRVDRMVALGFDDPGALTVYLRRSPKATRPGPQVVGVRSLVCNVGSLAELDRVEERLGAHDSFRVRQKIHETEVFELVHGYDPDRLSLTFLAYEAGATMSLDDYCRVMTGMYSVDV
jgi:catechol 2,3-dioxygenase-like lactoylglutathione lyase family enzyme